MTLPLAPVKQVGSFSVGGFSPKYYASVAESCVLAQDNALVDVTATSGDSNFPQASLIAITIAPQVRSFRIRERSFTGSPNISIVSSVGRSFQDPNFGYADAGTPETDTATTVYITSPLASIGWWWNGSVYLMQ